MTLQLNRLLINVEQYYKMAEVGIIKPTDRVELIGGEIITRSPSKSPHAGVVNLLTQELIWQLKGKATITVQNPLRLSKDSEPEPDLLIAKLKKDGYSKRHPRAVDAYVVVEVSDSSLSYDRKIKLPLYAKAGIPEYWIVNVAKKQIEQYLQPEGGKYLKKSIIRKTGVIKMVFPVCSIKVSAIFP